MVARKVGSVQWLRDSSPAHFRNFYQLAKNMSASQVKALCQRQVHVAHQQEWGWAANGEYKPSSVWETLGYNKKDIEEKALPEDTKTDPTYGWTVYRVRIHSTHEGEKTQHSDALQLLAKCRTRALKCRRTDESEKAVDQKEESESFSSEASNDSDSDKDKLGGKAAKAKAKGNAKASAGDKAKAKVKVAAKAAAKKVRTALESLRKKVGSPNILEVDDNLMGRVRSSLRQLTAIEKAADKATSSGVDNFTSDLDDFDFQKCKDLEKELKKQLQRLEKRTK